MYTLCEQFGSATVSNIRWQLSGGSRISQMGWALTPGTGASTYYVPNFCRKLHENEIIWTEGGGACVFLVAP